MLVGDLVFFHTLFNLVIRSFRGGDPFAVLEGDERFAVPSIEDVKKMKRSGKSSRNDGRSNVRD